MFFSFRELNQSGYFNLDHIEVFIDNSAEQARYLKSLAKELNAELEIYRGDFLWHVDLKKIQGQIEMKSWVDEVVLKRDWPSSLKVKIRVKPVEALILAKGGQFIPVVENGLTLPALDLERVPNVAVLRGENFEHQFDLRRRAISLLHEMPSQGRFSKKNVSEIHFEEHEGFWVTLMNSSVEVRMGQDEIPAKAQRVSQVLDYIDARNLDARVIDANLSKKVLVRLRKGP